MIKSCFQFYSFLVLFFIISGCSKSYSPVLGPYTDVSSALSDGSVHNNIVTLNAATGGTFYDSSGTRYVIPPAAFVTGNGQPVTGQITITAASYLKKSDILFSRMLTVADGEPLASGGEYYINASQNGSQLQLAQNQVYAVSIPITNKKDTGMQLYFGTLLDTNTNKTSIVNWQLNTSPSLGHISYPSIDTMTIITNQLGLINGDKIMQLQNSLNGQIADQSFTIRLTSVQGMSNIVSAYVIYDSSNTVVPLPDVKNGYITVDNVPNVPVHFVVFAIINGDFYADILPAVPMTGIIYGMDLIKTTPAAIKVQLDLY